MSAIQETNNLGDLLKYEAPNLYSRDLATVSAGQNLVLRAEPGPDAAVVAAQLRHEMPALLAAHSPFEGVGVTLIWPGADDPASEPLASALAAILAGKPHSLALDDGSGATDQIYPEVARDYVTELGRRDSGTPPMLMLGLDVARGKRHFAALRAKLGALGETLSGRRVLLVLRNDGNDVPAARKDPVVAAAREIVDPVAAATLVFRGSDAQGRAFFEVVDSKVEGLAVGTKVRDPRPKA